LNDPFFGDYRIESYVVGRCNEAFDLLERIRETDQTRCMPHLAPEAESKRAVVEPAAHAKSDAARIETHEGQEHDIEPPCTDRLCALGLVYAEAIAALWTCQFHEAHLVARRMAIDAGYIDDAAAAASDIDQWGGVELSRHGGIDGDAPARTQMEIAVRILRNELGGAGTIGGGYGSAAGSQLLPQCLAIVRRYGCSHEVKNGLGAKRSAVSLSPSRRKPRFAPAAERSAGVGFC
jgi:hypothetical protein